MPENIKLSFLFLIVFILNYTILTYSIEFKSQLHESIFQMGGKIYNLERLYLLDSTKIKREEHFESNHRAEFINDLIKQKLIERLKSLYVVTTRSR